MRTCEQDQQGWSMARDLDIWLIQLVEWLPGMHKALALGFIPAWYKLRMVAHICNPSTREVDAGRTEVQGYPQLQNESEDSLGYMRVCLKKKIIVGNAILLSSVIKGTTKIRRLRNRLANARKNLWCLKWSKHWLTYIHWE